MLSKNSKAFFRPAPPIGILGALFFPGACLLYVLLVSRTAQGEQAVDDPKKARQRVDREAGCDGDQNGVAPKLHARSRFHDTLSADSGYQKKEASAIHEECLVSADFAKSSVRFHVGGMLRCELVFFLAARMLELYLWENGRPGFRGKGCAVGSGRSVNGGALFR